MENTITNSADALLTQIRQLFRNDLALENDYLRQENRILRSKLVPLTDKDRRVLVKYGLRIRDDWQNRNFYFGQDKQDCLDLLLFRFSEETEK